MEWLKQGVDFLLHVQDHLDWACQTYGAWVYLILFIVIFAETGLVVTPFLPGDSLLFAAGAIASRGTLNPLYLFVLLSVAAIIGDTVNYWIGKVLGPRVMNQPNSRIFRREYLDRTHAFFERYGGKTIVLARFVPIVRTFAPFVAGAGAMNYTKFIIYNVVGGIAWVAICLYAGVFFGQIDFVKKHFELVVLVIIFISILPGVFEFFRVRAELKRNPRALEPAAQSETE